MSQRRGSSAAGLAFPYRRKSSSLFGSSGSCSIFRQSAGGPAEQIELMHQAFVKRRRWNSE